MFDIKQMQEMVAQMGDKAKEMEEKNKNTIFTSKSGGGLVSISINGACEILDISINDELLNDKSSLQILLISALNDAYKNVENNRKNTALNMFTGRVNPFA